MSKYDENFYISQMEESYNSAKEMLNQILPLLPKINSVQMLVVALALGLKLGKIKTMK
ncbi:hypothetical protein SNU31_001753 [Campylobacter coli]|nr:hypothetical protein [Campylobacter coli]